jgi:hypothetical protein
MPASMQAAMATREGALVFARPVAEVGMATSIAEAYDVLSWWTSLAQEKSNAGL